MSGGGSLLGWLAALASGRPDQPAQGPGASGPATAESAAAEEDQFEALAGVALEQWLRGAMAAQPAGFDRRVQLLSLAPVAARYGAGWAALADKVDIAVGNAAARRLGPRDLFARAGDRAYLLVFAAATEAEARLKCALLARDVAARLLGEHAKDADIETASVSIEGSQVAVTRYSKLELGDGMPAALVPAGAADRDAIEAPAERERLAGRMETTALAHPVPPREAAPPPIGWLSEEQRLHSELIGLLSRTEGAMVKEQRRRSAAVATALSAGGIGFRYEPMWHVTTRVINAYLCLPAIDVDGRLRLGRQLLPPDPEPRLLAALDGLVLRQCIRELHRMAAAGIANLVCVPVHHPTLLAPMLRQEYMAICETIDAGIRQRLMFELVEPMLGFSNTQLPPAITALKRHGRAVLVRVTLDHAHLSDFAGLGLAAVGAVLQDDGTPEVELQRKIDLFRARADRYGLRCYLRGLATASLTTAAVYAGFEYLAGGAIADLTDSPEAVQSFSLANFYLQNYVKTGAD